MRNQPIKFKYDDKHIVFFVYWKGTFVEILKARAPSQGADMLPTILRLKREAQFEANTLLNLLARKAA